VSTTDQQGQVVFGADLYDPDTAQGAPDAAVAVSLGCGVPTAVADLHPGETVLDLGSGAGADVLIAARRVAPGGRVIGLDMTEEMLELARRNAPEAGVINVEFLHGYLEDIPLPDATVDVVISNCVINLAADKLTVLREAARVLRPGGRITISDVIADPGMDASTQTDMTRWTGCIAGALTKTQYEHDLTAAGLIDVAIIETTESTPAPRPRSSAPANPQLGIRQRQVRPGSREVPNRHHLRTFVARALPGPFIRRRVGPGRGAGGGRCRPAPGLGNRSGLRR
jgi:arsenite methyltransferase